MLVHDVLRPILLKSDLSSAVALLDELVSIDTPSRDKVALSKAMGVVARELSGRGFTVTMTVDGANVPLLLADRGTGKSFGLVGHLDTVFGEGEAGRRPFTVEGDIATGPGVADMKGGVVALIQCVDLLDVLGNPPALRIVINGDEESGSPGSRSPLVDALRDVEAALIFEPGRPGGEFVGARRGTVRARIRVEGIASHSGVAPRDGANAIHDIAQRIVEIARLGDEFPDCDVNVNRIAGGVGINTIPAAVEAEIDARTSSVAADEGIQRRFNEIVDAPGVPRTTCTIEWLASRPPLERHPRQNHLIESFMANGEALGISVDVVATGGGSDGNLLGAQGITVIDGCGPVGGGYHRSDEFIRLTSLLERAAVCAATLHGMSR